MNPYCWIQTMGYSKVWAKSNRPCWVFVFDLRISCKPNRIVEYWDRKVMVFENFTISYLIWFKIFVFEGPALVTWMDSNNVLNIQSMHDAIVLKSVSNTLAAIVAEAANPMVSVWSRYSEMGCHRTEFQSSTIGSKFTNFRNSAASLDGAELRSISFQWT